MLSVPFDVWTAFGDNAIVIKLRQTCSYFRALKELPQEFANTTTVCGAFRYVSDRKMSAFVHTSWFTGATTVVVNVALVHSIDSAAYYDNCFWDVTIGDMRHMVTAIGRRPEFIDKLVRISRAGKCRARVHANAHVRAYAHDGDTPLVQVGDHNMFNTPRLYGVDHPHEYIICRGTNLTRAWSISPPEYFTNCGHCIWYKHK